MRALDHPEERVGVAPGLSPPTLFFGQEGALRGREFGDQAQSFSALAVLHDAVVAWNMIEVEGVVARLRAAGHDLADEVLGLTTPLLRKHINPIGRYHFDLGRLRDSLERCSSP